jgi:aldehyde:ferredoxin oxidoreductase
LDSLILCKFLRKCFEDVFGEAAELLGKVTGWSFSGGELRRVGERVSTLKRLFNIREGWKPEDDWLPTRLLEEPLTGGADPGPRLGAAELREMIEGYYRARGWSGGLVPAETIAELGVLDPWDDPCGAKPALP